MKNELLPAEIKTLPEIVDETGKALDAGVDVMGIVAKIAELAQLAKIRKSLQREEFEGKLDSRKLDVTDELQKIELVLDWPNFKPWISAFIINRGPNTAKIGINEKVEWDESKWLEIEMNGSRMINHAKADRRIERIYYQCDPGETASLTIEGQY